MGEFSQTNNIQLHYYDHAGNEPTIVLMPGLSANANSFDGLVSMGFPYRLLAVDLRGRGLSSKPESGYSMAEHAADIIGLLDALGLEKVVLGGHSFGGLLTAYTAVHYPHRVSHCLIIDAGFLHPNVRQLIQPSLDRLGQTVESWDVYEATIKATPFWRGYWDTAVASYYRADVETLPDGRVKPRSRPEAIIEAVEDAQAQPWGEIFGKVTQPTLMLNALGPYGPDGTPPVVPYDKAQETVAAFSNIEYVEIPGNHMTMLFGENAKKITQAIDTFIKK